MRHYYLGAGMCILFAANVFAATPANDELLDEKQQQRPQQVKPAVSSKPPVGAPAVRFTPSEKVGADSAVSFPVDI